MRIDLPEQTPTSRTHKNSSSTSQTTSKKKKTSCSPYPNPQSKPIKDPSPQVTASSPSLPTARTPTPSFESADSTLPQSPKFSKNPSTHTAAPSVEDAFEDNPLPRIEDGEDLFFDRNISYDHPSLKSLLENVPAEISSFPTQVSLNSSPLSPKSAPFSSGPNLEEHSQPLPEVPVHFSSFDSLLATQFDNSSKDKAGSLHNKSASGESKPNKKSVGNLNNKQLKLLTTIRKDQKKLQANFSHIQNTIA
uniref:Flocculation protein FLO11-like n=1 Tax=Cicer arietinum TaxID=3827 RepID=A0A1S3EIA6_CICAR|nr:flocculation protein FLO11-like [Cicer arietinum]